MNNSTRKITIKNIVSYSIVKYFAMFLGFFISVISAKNLGPELFGILGVMLLSITYLNYANFGVLYSMNKEYVVADNKNKEQVINTAFTFLLLCSLLIVFISILLYIVTYFNNSLINYQNFILPISLIAVLDQFRLFHINYFRLNNNIEKINKIELGKNFLSFIFIFILIQFYSIYGVIYGMLISNILIFFYALKISRKLKISLDFLVLRKLIVLGIPLLIYNLGFFILNTIDRLFIIKYLEPIELGNYTFATQLITATLMIISSILFLYYPQAIKLLNKDANSERDINHNIEKYTKIIEFIGVILALGGIIVVNLSINVFMKEFNGSIDIYKILIFGMVLNQLSYLVNVYLVTNQKQSYLVLGQLISIIVAIGLNIIVVSFGWGILGIALATFMTNFLYSLIQYFFYLKFSKFNGNYTLYIYGIFFRFSMLSFIGCFFTIINTDLPVYIACIVISTLVIYRNLIMKIMYRQKNKI